MLNELRSRRWNVPIKLLGWVLTGVGMLVLAEPVFELGIVANPSTMLGIILQFTGLVMIVGLPSLSKIWNSIEYGVYAILFLMGLTLIYLQYQPWEAFKVDMLRYSSIAILAGFVSVVMNQWLS